MKRQALQTSTRRTGTAGPDYVQDLEGLSARGGDPFPFHRDSRLHKVGVVAVLIVPLLAAIYAIASPWLGLGPHLVDVFLFAGMWAFTGLGVSVGYHRMLTHKAVTMRRPTRMLLLIAGSMALQGSPADWAATHTRHHSKSDKDGDPHSPQDGFWHAHCLWLLRDRFVRSGLAHDKLMSDPITRFVSRTWLLWAVVGLAVPTAIGFAVTGTGLGALNGFVWGGALRVFVGHHITWTVNSLGHKFGTRPYLSADQSTNNWLVALLGWGEGWHNNHHAFPRSAYIGLRWWQIDIGSVLIVALKWLGQVTAISVPDKGQRLNRRRSTVMPKREGVGL